MIVNGITLCQDCHALEHPFISRDEKDDLLAALGQSLQKTQSD
jgi:hypothetical protein